MNTNTMGRAGICMAAVAVAGIVFGATGVKTDRFDKYGNPKPLMTVFKVTPIEQRLAKINPVAEGELRVVPLFENCSVTWGVAKEIEGLALEYRAKGTGDWMKAPPIPYFENVRNYRGSMMGLRESTDYEFRLVAGGDVKASGAFRTWSTKVPIAKTIEIDPATATWPIKVDAKGSPDGWIRYTAKGGAVLDVKGSARAFAVDGAQYVLLDDMVLKGGRGRNMIRVERSKGVRIRNCDISDWGRDSKPNYAHKGLWAETKKPYGVVNFDGAIAIGRGASETVVERCYVHDAHSRANSWYYAHPAGPEAVTMECPDHSTVIRWNDFVGSDIHPWNDAVEGAGNFDDDGGFNRDGDVYGNFMIYCNDDNIELDGGMQNVRCYQNRFEAAGCGVSIQGCMVSPVYVTDNMFSGLGEEHHLVMQTIKTSSYEAFGNGSWCWIKDNLFWGSGTGVNVFPIRDNPLSLMARWNVFDNRFSGPDQKLVGEKAAPHFNGGGNTFESVAFDETKLDTSYPKRPLRFLLDRARISLTEPFAPVKVKATSTSANGIPFRVRVNRDFDWFTVSPAEGTIPPKGEVEFTVSFRPERMKTFRRYRGAFLVQDLHGLSCPVSIHCTTTVVPPYHAEKPGDAAVYAAGCRPGEFIRADGNWRTYEFDLPKDGTWYFLIHGYSESITGDLRTNNRQVLQVQVDDLEAAPSFQQWRAYPVWTLLMPGKRFGNFACPFELKAGKHTVRIRNCSGNTLYDGVVATDACGSFEPK